AKFYQPAGLKKLAQQLNSGGVFALWSNNPPVQFFIDRMETIFRTATAVEVPFYNPLQGHDFVQSIYLACA
ncbi:spermidine synthase, partial [Candidatus Puniceispirillum sp.]|nr:spermidine synthase [Candidatus Puniceispirillum sp.]